MNLALQIPTQELQSKPYYIRNMYILISEFDVRVLRKSKDSNPGFYKMIYSKFSDLRKRGIEVVRASYSKV